MSTPLFDPNDPVVSDQDLIPLVIGNDKDRVTRFAEGGDAASSSKCQNGLCGSMSDSEVVGYPDGYRTRYAAGAAYSSYTTSLSLVFPFLYSPDLILGF